MLTSNLGGVAAPFITGWIVSETGSFRFAIWTAAAILIAGVAAYSLLLKTIEPEPWKTT